jgi:hypothetical protein
MSDIVTVGLAQMDDAGLRRVVKHIDAGKPLCLDGTIVNRHGHG